MRGIPVTKLLDKAIASIRDLPDDDQDEAAEFLFAFASRNRGTVSLDEETRNAIEEGRRQARNGEFATEAEMSEFFRRHRE
jgi:hypothetical protein